MINKILNPKLLLIIILLLAFFVRLYQFQRPIADWHSWRQVDTSSVSRNFVKYGFDILHPRFDDLSKGVSLLDNPDGYRFVEFPFYNIAQAGLYMIFGGFTLEQWGRLITIFSQLVSIVFIYLLVKHYINARAGFIAASFFAFIPYNIYFGRTLLPDSSMIAALLGSTYFFVRWIDDKNFQPRSNRGQFFLAVILMAVAVLLKPYALFFSLPLIYLALKHFGFSIYKQWQLWLFVFLSITPFILWRLWMQQYPEGIPQSNWLFNGDGIRFKGAFFNWIFADRISRLILGYFGLPFVILGMLAKVKKEQWFFFMFLFSSLIYLNVMAKGNVQHDYYQLLIIPTLAIFFAKGIDFVLEKSGEFFNRLVAYAVITVSVLFIIAFSWFIVRDFYNLQHIEVIAAGKAVDRLTPQNAKIIAPYGGDTTFLYHTNRRGWPVFDRPLRDFIKQGAMYMAFVNPSEPELNFIKYFKTVNKGERYIIYDLTQPLPASEEILKPEKQKK